MLGQPALEGLRIVSRQATAFWSAPSPTSERSFSAGLREMRSSISSPPMPPRIWPMPRCTQPSLKLMCGARSSIASTMAAGWRGARR